jgi:hypothetical protein
MMLTNRELNDIAVYTQVITDFGNPVLLLFIPLYVLSLYFEDQLSRSSCSFSERCRSVDGYRPAKVLMSNYGQMSVPFFELAGLAAQGYFAWRIWKCTFNTFVRIVHLN